MGFKLKIGDTVVPNKINSVTETVVNASDLIRRPENAAVAEHAPAITINLGLQGLSVMELLELFQVDSKKRSTQVAVLLDADTEEQVISMEEYNYIQTITRQLSETSRCIIITLYRYTDCVLPS